jgi:hypothetical protein
MATLALSSPYWTNLESSHLGMLFGVEANSSGGNGARTSLMKDGGIMKEARVVEMYLAVYVERDKHNRCFYWVLSRAGLELATHWLKGSVPLGHLQFLFRHPWAWPMWQNHQSFRPPLAPNHISLFKFFLINISNYPWSPCIYGGIQKSLCI